MPLKLLYPCPPYALLQISRPSAAVVLAKAIRPHDVACKSASKSVLGKSSSRLGPLPVDVTLPTSPAFSFDSLGGDPSYPCR